MFERFTDRARRVVVLSQEHARALRHAHINTGHILLGLISEGEGVAAKALEALNVRLDSVPGYVDEATDAKDVEGRTGYMPFSPHAKEVLELALREALQLGHNYIGTEHILLALVRDGLGVGAHALTDAGLALSDVRDKVLHLLVTDGKSTINQARESQGLRRYPDGDPHWMTPTGPAIMDVPVDGNGVADLSGMSREDAAAWLDKQDRQERLLKYDLAALMGHLHPDDMMKELSKKQWRQWQEWFAVRQPNG